jgi:hypothetical protein
VTAELLLSIVAEGDEPVSKIKKKDEESDAIVAELEARLKEMKQSMATESVIPPEPEDLPTEEEAESPQQEEEPAEETAAAIEATEEAGEAEVETVEEAAVEEKVEEVKEVGEVEETEEQKDKK